MMVRLRPKSAAYHTKRCAWKQTFVVRRADGAAPISADQALQSASQKRTRQLGQLGPDSVVPLL